MKGSVRPRVVASGTRAAVAVPMAALLVACSLVGAPPGQRTFYVSPAGDDTARGTSAGSPWRSLERASEAVLVPGDRVLLLGGARFTGRLLLDRLDAGNAADPVVVGSYGDGRAEIDAPGDGAVVVTDTGGVEISDLVLAGAGPEPVPGSAGVRVFTDSPDDRVFDHVVVQRVEAHGFGNGIEVGSARAGTGFRDVRVDDAVLHDNRDAGLTVYGPAFDATAPRYAHEDVVISRVTAYGNHGDPANTRRNTGSGIVLGSVRTATVTRSVAHDNGGSGGSGEGPVGIWTYDSTGVVIEHCLSYRNRTARLADGGGFGLDQNNSDSVLQYNLSYDNHGPGYLVYTGQQNDAHTGSVVRFNVSSGDARRWSVYGGITVLGRVSATRIYQNTVVMAPQRSDPSSALRLGPGVSDLDVRNNLLVSRQAGPVVVAVTPYARSAVRLDGNAYVGSAAAPTVVWGPEAEPSLRAWRAATGQETSAGRRTGLTGDPGLPGPLTGLAATAVDDPAVGFLPSPGSPLLGAGLPLADLLTPGVTLLDRTGAPVRTGSPDVGAVQRAQSG